ncbi:MAG TPA: PTS sugar transporter subunit IIA [Firmicutes bacterium]|nr:PTS sugar transporter subunit IIA [Candidatus Fermentithermobacillaceae bacterium]
MAEFELDSNLVIGPFEAKDATQALRYIAEHLVRLGYVKETYPDAVISREKEFPTGLPTNGPGVAIPHCDPSHVIKPAIAVATLAHPVPFGLMGGKQATVPVDIIMMLAINDPSTQIDILRQVSLMVQNPRILNSLKSATCQREVIKILKNVFTAPDSECVRS